MAVRDLGLPDARDEAVLERARHDDRVIVSHDTDFGTLLAVQRRSTPSFILIRSADPLTTAKLTKLIIDNLDVMFEDLTAGAIIGQILLSAHMHQRAVVPWRGRRRRPGRPPPLPAGHWRASSVLQPGARMNP